MDYFPLTSCKRICHFCKNFGELVGGACFDNSATNQLGVPSLCISIPLT